MGDFAVVLFEELQQYRALRLELLSSLSGNQVTVGEFVNAREHKNLNLKRAKLLFKGPMSECDHEYASLVKNQIKDNKKSDRMKPTKQMAENLELLEKLAKLTNDFDELYMKFNELKQVNIEKDEQIASLQVQIDELENFKNTVNLRSPILDSEIQPACNSCEKIATDVTEIKEKLRILVELFENNQNKSTHFESNGLTRLGPNSSIYVNLTRFIAADRSNTPTAFVQKILTAVFTYDEIIGSTMTGRSTKSRKRRLVQKCLPKDKLADLIRTVNLRYQGDGGLQNVRKDIGWKVSNLNNGIATQNDLLYWDGYDKEDFESLSSKKASTSSTVSISEDTTNVSITTAKEDSPISLFANMSNSS